MGILKNLKKYLLQSLLFVSYLLAEVSVTMKGDDSDASSKTKRRTFSWNRTLGTQGSAL
jgi:hypothetical protein